MGVGATWGMFCTQGEITCLYASYCTFAQHVLLNYFCRTEDTTKGCTFVHVEVWRYKAAAVLSHTLSYWQSEIFQIIDLVEVLTGVVAENIHQLNFILNKHSLWLFSPHEGHSWSRSWQHFSEVITVNSCKMMVERLWTGCSLDNSQICRLLTNSMKWDSNSQRPSKDRCNRTKLGSNMAQR